MVQKRYELNALLKDITTNVYFQPPTNKALEYPCIVYKLSTIDIKHGNNLPYKWAKRYSITVIDRNPDSSIPDEICKLSTASFDRMFVADGLNHWVINIYW